MRSSTTHTGQSQYGYLKTVNLSLALAVLGLPACRGLAGYTSDEVTFMKSDRVSQTSRAVAGGGDECADVDGDGYGVGPDCLGPDCDDGSAAVNPGMSEACDGVNAKCCNDVDDNCDGNTDENATAHARDGDPQSRCCVDDTPGASCTGPEDCAEGNCLPSSSTYLREIDLPLGAMCVNGFGVCAKTGTVVCKADETGAECDAVPGPPEEGGEGLDDQGIPDPTVETCFDRRDNDCDGFVDHGNSDEGRDTLWPTAELCDGFDNDNDGEIDNGFGLGGPCSVGVGLCADAGTVICDSSGGTTCTASPLPPSFEGPPASHACADEKDNDCDGLTDLGDPDCQETEKCDGKDNDGDGGIDEDFADLGSPCTSGVGTCAARGVKVCSASQEGTACAAVPLPPSHEGPHKVTFSMVELYVAKLREKGNKLPTINKKLRYLRTALKRAVTRGVAAANPMDGWTWEREDKPQPRVISDDEEKALLDATECLYGFRWWAFVYVALQTRARRGELLELTWGRVDFGEGSTLFTHTKGKQDRIVPLHDRTVAVLRKLQAQTLQLGGPFVGMHKPMERRWGRIVREAGITHVTPHDLRRTCATRLLEAGVSVKTVQDIMGHASAVTTLKHYAGVTEQAKRNAIEGLCKAL